MSCNAKSSDFNLYDWRVNRFRGIVERSGELTFKPISNFLRYEFISIRSCFAL